MAAEIAREIIEQSRPCDRATRAVIKMQDRFNSLKITTPIVDGAQVFQLDFSISGVEQKAPLRYNARHNREAAVACVRGFVDCPSGYIYAIMHIRNDDGSESPELFRWHLHPNSEKKARSATVDLMLTALLTDN